MHARRIASLLPSATEIICALGLQDRLVGVTHECDFPPFVRDKPKITHTHIPADADSSRIDEMVRERLAGGSALYSLDEPALRRLAPDLIVTQTLCDVCAVADRDVLAAAANLPGPPRVVHLEPTRFDEVLDSLGTVAVAAGVPERAAEVLGAIDDRIARIRDRAADLTHRPRVVVLEWLNPLFSCGHWTPELVEIAGGFEPLARAGDRSRRIEPAELAAADPDAILIACCGFGIERTRQDVPALLAQPGVASMRCVKGRRVYLTDGSAYFSRPGPRLVDSLEIAAAVVRAAAADGVVEHAEVEGAF